MYTLVVIAKLLEIKLIVITYMISTYYTDCSVDCKINYYKYENVGDLKIKRSSQLKINILIKFQKIIK